VTVRQWLQRHSWFLLWAPVLLWMCLIFLLSAQPDLPHPGSGWLDLVVSSAAHVFLFGVLAVFFVRALAQRRRVWMIALVLTMLYALADEFHQGFVPGRHRDPLDLLFDGLGAVLALTLWFRMPRRRCR
jgi:VanZ family protein